MNAAQIRQLLSNMAPVCRKKFFIQHGSRLPEKIFFSQTT
jgi:hypothetical protein